MGIRLRCPNGHKLNVKSFLAGKRGVCPHCGAKFDIPSDQKATHDSGDELSLPPPAGDLELPLQAVEFDQLPAPTSAPVHTAPILMPLQVAPQPPIQPVARDPIAEAPGAVWYVRHPVAGQFGPAPAELFRQWLGEGRITADSLVWREGWAEWQSARAIFPQFSPAPVPLPRSPFEAVPGPTDAFGIPEETPILPGIKSIGQAGRGRKKNDQTMVIMTIVMLVVVVVLGIIFVVVLNQTSQPDPSPDTTVGRQSEDHQTCLLV